MEFLLNSANVLLEDPNKMKTVDINNLRQTFVIWKEQVEGSEK